MPNRRRIINASDPQRSYIDLDVSEPVAFITVVPASQSREARQSRKDGGRFSRASGRNFVPLEKDLSSRLVRLSVDAKTKRATKAEFTFWNEDLALSDTAITQKGTLIKVRWGYSGFVGRKRTFRVKKVKGTRARVKTSGQLTVVAYGQSADLGNKQRSKTYFNTTANNLVRQIARRYGIGGEDLVLDPSQTSVISSIHQVNQTDQQFLAALAQKLGWMFTLEDGVLTFAPHVFIDQCKPIATWSFFTDEKGWIKRFEPEGNVLSEVGSVTVKSRDPSSGKIVQSTATVRTKKGKSLGRFVPVKPDASGGQNTQQAAGVRRVHRSKSTSRPGVVPSGQIINRPASTSAQVKREAQARMNNRQMRLFKARALNIGDPEIWKDRTVRFNNVGKDHSGNWMVREVIHVLDSSGYIIDMKVRRNGSNTLGRGQRPTTDQTTRSQFASSRPSNRVQRVTKATSSSVTGTRKRTRNKRR